MKHVKRILALALIVVSLFAVAMPASATISNLTSGNASDLLHTKANGKKNFQIQFKMTGVSGAFDVQLQYNQTSGGTVYSANGGSGMYSAGVTQYAIGSALSSHSPYEYWIRINPAGLKTMSIEWYASCS